MDHQSNLTVWKSENETIRAIALAFQISRRLRHSLDHLPSKHPLKYTSAAVAATLLEVRDFSETKGALAAPTVNEFYLRNKSFIQSLVNQKLIEQTEGSAIRFRLTTKGGEMATEIYPLAREVFEFS